jgi:hypothetical protein
MQFMATTNSSDPSSPRTVGPQNPTSRALESQPTATRDEGVTSATAVSASTTSADDDQGLEDNSNVPRFSIPYIFWFFFYNFGLFAWEALWLR